MNIKVKVMGSNSDHAVLNDLMPKLQLVNDSRVVCEFLLVSFFGSVLSVTVL